MSEENRISIKEISKSFAGVKALKSVSLDIVAGKVHGLIGANGAGKSTLIKILAGIYQPDSGEIYIDNKKAVISSPAAAAGLGLSFIHQELNLVPDFNVAENLTLGLKKEARLGLINWGKTTSKLQQVLQIVGFRKSAYTPIRDLSVAEQWLIAIAKALYQDVKFIAMDEPTAALSEDEVETLFSIIRDLTARGIGVIYVSHRLDEVVAICDEVTVFKDGCNIMHRNREDLTKEAIITAIAGHRLEALDAVEYHLINAATLLDVQDLKVEKKVRGVSFHVKQGEVLGLTGLVGAGRTETAMAVFGALKRKSGQFTFNGSPYSPRRPGDAVRAGIVLIPEDRRREGLITNQTLSFNINLPSLFVLRTVPKLPLISLKKGAAVTQEAVRALNIKTSGLNEQILNLSGGNQQKVVIGKWLKRNPRLIIMDEPTQGVDVGARAEIYRLIRDMAQKNGVTFLIISSDIEELPGLCDRVIVMAEGRISGELIGSQIKKETLLHLCYANVAAGETNDGEAKAHE